MKKKTIRSIRLMLLSGLMLMMFSARGSAKDNSISDDLSKQGRIVVMKLDGKITETPPGIDFGISEMQLNIVWDQLRFLRMVANDKSVKGLVLLINQPELSMAQCEQIQEELAKVKKAGKKVFVHCDSVMSSEYLMAVPADKIAMSPGTSLMLTGISAGTVYYKSLMEKLGVSFDVIHFGNYKLAAEPFTSTQPSEFMDEQMNDLVDNLYNHIISTISNYRKIDSEKVRSIIDKGPYIAESALKEKLIDAVSYRKEFLEQIRKELSGKLVFDYGETPTPPVQSGFSGLVQLFSMIGSKGTDSTSTQNKIAIVYICGMIVEGESEEYFSGEGTTVGSETLRKTFSEIQKNDKIKAVVLRINSPGGSSSASEIIWQLVDETRKTKPVVVSMGSTAASGGYYIACAGSPILLSPMTITGSIGVIAGKPNIQGLMEKVHLHHYNWSRGKNSRLTDMLSPLTADERKNLHAQMQHIYDTFKDRVTRSRKGKIADVSKLATGRVFTGMQAIKLGLADQIGTLADAVELAAQQAKIKSYTVVHRPKPKTLPEIIMEALGYKLDGESDISDSKILAKFVLNSSRFVSISGLSGEAIAKSLAIISMLKRNSILTMMTFDIELR